MCIHISMFTHTRNLSWWQELQTKYGHSANIHDSADIHRNNTVNKASIIIFSLVAQVHFFNLSISVILVYHWALFNYSKPSLHLMCPQGQPVKSDNIFVAVKTCKKFPFRQRWVVHSCWSALLTHTSPPRSQGSSRSSQEYLDMIWWCSKS